MTGVPLIVKKAAINTKMVKKSTNSNMKKFKDPAFLLFKNMKGFVNFLAADITIWSILGLLGVFYCKEN